MLDDTFFIRLEIVRVVPFEGHAALDEILDGLVDVVDGKVENREGGRRMICPRIPIHPMLADGQDRAAPGIARRVLLKDRGSIDRDALTYMA